MPQKPDLIEECCLCTEIGINQIPNIFARNCSLETRIVFSTDNFVALPSLAPLVEGHMLLLPKNHITSLAQLTSDQMEEFKNLLKFVCRKINKLWSGPIIFEHGVGSGKTGGCGVTHAHLHLVPLSSVNKVSLWSLIIQELDEFPFQATLFEILDRLDPKDSYLLIGEDLNRISCRVSDTLPSQLMRKLVADTLLLPCWDWREMFNWKYIESTYRKLKGAA